MVWVLAGVIVVLVIVVGVLLARLQRSRQLQRDFGPEYRRAVSRHGDQRLAEKELTERRRRMTKFDIRPLDPAARELFTERWAATQRHFVDEPAVAVGEAHALVQEVMRERGYPVDDDFEQRAADISVDHSAVVENYRAAHQISLAARKGQASTEQLRQSMIHSRALLDDLLTPEDDGRTDEVRGERERTSRGAKTSTVSDHMIGRG